MTDSISLKFGGLKYWNCESPVVLNLIDMYLDAKYNISEYAMTRKHLLCLIIDLSDCDRIYMDFYDKWIFKAEAKEYVMGYDES
jgi:hypothetical protein